MEAERFFVEEGGVDITLEAAVLVFEREKTESAVVETDDDKYFFIASSNEVGEDIALAPCGLLVEEVEGILVAEVDRRSRRFSVAGLREMILSVEERYTIARTAETFYLRGLGPVRWWVKVSQ